LIFSDLRHFFKKSFENIFFGVYLKAYRAIDRAMYRDLITKTNISCIDMVSIAIL
jgi:hypothetical protein